MKYTWSTYIFVTEELIITLQSAKLEILEYLDQSQKIIINKGNMKKTIKHSSNP